MRDLCPALQNKTYFNYGGQGLCPAHPWRPSRRAGSVSVSGLFTADVWPYIATEVNSTRRLLPSAAVFRPIVLPSRKTTSGCVLPIWGLPFARGTVADRRLRTPRGRERLR